MNNRNILAALSYITWIGFLIAFFMGDKSDDHDFILLLQAFSG